MPTPRIPNDIKPTIQGYGIDAPEGVRMTEVAGGMPRVALDWRRGRQAFRVRHVMRSDKYFIWTLFFHSTIRNGAVQFLLPMDSIGMLGDHLAIMVPGSYSAARAGGQVWEVSYTVLAETQAYGVSDEDAAGAIEVWNEYGDGLEAILDLLAEVALRPGVPA